MIGYTARDVCTWRWRYIRLCEREENQSTLSVHVSGNYVVRKVSPVRGEKSFACGPGPACPAIERGPTAPGGTRRHRIEDEERRSP